MNEGVKLNTIKFALDVIRKEVISIEEASKHSFAFKECSFLACIKCGDKIKYKHGDVNIPYFAHDMYGDGHEFCPLYTPGSANHPITKIRYQFYSNINIQLYYFVIIENEKIRYFIMLPKLSDGELDLYSNNNLSIRILYSNGYKEIPINKEYFEANEARYIELDFKPSLVFLRFYQKSIEKTKLAFSCDDKTALFRYEINDGRIILRKCYDKITIGSKYAFFSYKKYTPIQMKEKGFKLLFSKDNYYLYSVYFEKFNIQNYTIASDKKTFLAITNEPFDYESDFDYIRSKLYKESVPKITPPKKPVPPIPKIPNEMIKYINYIIVVDNPKAKTRGFALINEIKVNGLNDYSISVNFFKDENFMPCNIDAIFKFDTTEKYYKLLPPIMMDKIKNFKCILKDYEILLNGFNDIPNDYFKQWYKYDKYSEWFKFVIAEIILNRKPIIGNKDTIYALAQLISGLFKHDTYFKCNLSSQYEINSLNIENDEVIVFTKFFDTSRTLDEYLKLDNLNRNSIKLFTITKEGLEANRELIKDRFIFFDYILEPLDSYYRNYNLRVDWKNIKWYHSEDNITEHDIFMLRNNNIRLKSLVAALVCRPTIKRLFPDISNTLKWLKDEQIKSFVIDYLNTNKK